MISAIRSVRIYTFYAVKLKIVLGIYCLYHVDIIYRALSPILIRRDKIFGE